MATSASAPAPAPGNREVVVKIGLDSNGGIEAVPKYFYVSKKGNQEVRWECNQNHEHQKDPMDLPCFTVEFEKNDSPFYEFQFSSDSPVSGLVMRSVLAGPKIYKYTVRIGDKDLDPGGGVRP